MIMTPPRGWRWRARIGLLPGAVSRGALARLRWGVVVMVVTVVTVAVAGGLMVWAYSMEPDGCKCLVTASSVSTNTQTGVITVYAQGGGVYVFPSDPHFGDDATFIARFDREGVFRERGGARTIGAGDLGCTPPTRARHDPGVGRAGTCGCVHPRTRGSGPVRSGCCADAQSDAARPERADAHGNRPLHRILASTLAALQHFARPCAFDHGFWLSGADRCRRRSGLAGCAAHCDAGPEGIRAGATRHGPPSHRHLPPAHPSDHRHRRTDVIGRAGGVGRRPVGSTGRTAARSAALIGRPPTSSWGTASSRCPTDRGCPVPRPR